MVTPEVVGMLKVKSPVPPVVEPVRDAAFPWVMVKVVAELPNEIAALTRIFTVVDEVARFASVPVITH